MHGAMLPGHAGRPGRFLAGFLTGVCLIAWADPGFALRARQQADDSSGRGSVANALTAGLEEVDVQAEVDRHFWTVLGEKQKTGDPADDVRVLFLYPLGNKLLRRAEARSTEVYVLKDEHEPSRGIDRALLLDMVRRINPHFLGVFVNDQVKSDILSVKVTPELRGLLSMGLGTDNLDLVAAAWRGIPVSYVGRPGGGESVLTGATAEHLVTLFLTQWFRVLDRIALVREGEQVPPDRSWAEIFRRHLDQDRERYAPVIGDIHWAMLLRELRRLDEAVKIPLEDKFRGARNGKEGTVRSKQLSSVPEIPGLESRLGFSDSSGEFLERWLEQAHALGVASVFYTGKRNKKADKAGAQYVASLAELAETADYVVRAPGDESVFPETTSAWLIDSARWAVPANLSNPGTEIEAMLNSTLIGKQLGFLGVGPIGVRAAWFMHSFGVRLQTIQHNLGNPIYDQLRGELGMVPVPESRIREFIESSDGILSALPAKAPDYLTADNWKSLDHRRRVWAVDGRGQLFGRNPGEDRVFAGQVLKNPGVELATDVLLDEFLPLAKQPLLSPFLRRQVTVTPHVASNAESPDGRLTVRGDGMGRVLADNFDAMLADKKQAELPNPVKLPNVAAPRASGPQGPEAGLEEPQQRIERAIRRLSQSTFLPAVVSPKERALLRDLLQRVRVVPFDEKGIYLEGGAIHLGTSPGQNEATLAHLLVWGGRVWRAMERVSEKGRSAAASQPALSQRLLSAAELLRGVHIQLHTGPDTTIYKGKIFLAVGDSTTLPELALELVRAAGGLSREDPATSSVSPAQRAEELALAFLGETDAAARQQFETAREEGAAEGKREPANQKLQEPALDADLVTRIKGHLQLGSVSLEETWPVFAEELSAVLRLTSQDRKIRFLEGLYNVFGFILYSKNTATDVGVRDEQAARLNIASMAAEALAKALGRYLNDPFLGQKGTLSQKEALEETARGMEMENLLSYLRFGHIPEFLAQKIKKQEVSPEITHQLLRDQTLARRTSGMTSIMQQTARGMLTSQPTHTLLLTGPRPEETGSSGDVSREPKLYIPELAPEDGYRIGADGLIDEFLKTLETGGTLEDLKIPSVLLDNVQLALSRPQERTPSGGDELSDLLRFYHYLGSVERVQKAWRPFLKETDLSALAKEFQLSERAIVAGLFVWRVLQPRFDSDAEKTLLARLNELGKSTDAIFSFIAEFQKRFKTAQAVRREVTQAAREAHHAAVVADLQPQREERRDQERDRLLQQFAELGIPLGGPSTGGPSTGPAEDPGLSNAPTFEGFVYRLHRMVLDDEAVRSLNADRQAAEQAMARLVGGEKGAEGSFRPGRAAIMRPLHSDRVDDPLRFYIAGEIEGEPLAKALFNFFEGFQGFPKSRWWKENTIGSRLRSFQAALPDFATARLEVAAAKERAHEERLTHLETTQEDVLKRLGDLEKRFPSQGTGLEEVNLAGVAFLVFDPAAAPALARQLGPRGADLFVVAETPEIALKLLEQGISVDRIIGATGRGFLEDDYRSVHSLIQRFVYSYPDDWQAKLVDSLGLERLSQTIYPIYDPESLVKVLNGLAVPSPLIRSILEERAGMEEGTGREA